MAGTTIRNIVKFQVHGVEAVVSGTGRVRRAVQDAGEQVKQATKGMAASFKNLAGAFTSVVVGKAAFGLIGKAVRPAMELEDATSQLTVATGATGAELELLTEAAKRAAAATAFTPAEAIEGMKTLRLSVTEASSAAEALLPTLALAQTYFGGKVAPAVDLAAKTLRSFNLQGNELRPALDKILVMARLSGVQIGELRSGFARLGGAASLVNGSLEDFVPLLAMSVRAGVPANVAATGLFRAMQRLSDPKVRDLLQNSLGVVAEEGGQFKNVQEILLDLAKAWELNSGNVQVQSTVTKAFGSRALLPIIKIIDTLNSGLYMQGEGMRKNAGIFNSFRGAALGAGGTLESAQEEAMKPLSMQLEILSENSKLLLADAFAPLLQAVNGIITGINRFVEALKNAGPEVQILLDLFGFLVKAVASLGTVYVAGKAIQLVYAGTTRIVGAASVWAAENIGKQAINTATEAEIALGATVALNAQTAATKNLANATNTAGAAAVKTGKFFKSAWFRILGPIGLLAGLLEQFGVLSWVGRKLGIISPKKKAEEIAENKRLAAVSKQLEATNKLKESVLSFDSSVVKFRDIVKEKLPVEPRKAFSRIETAFNKATQEGNRSEEGLNRMADAMAAVNEVQKAFRGELILTPERLAAGKKGLQILSGQMAVQVATNKDLEKSMAGLEKMFTRIEDDTKAASSEIQKSGQVDEERVRHLQNLKSAALDDIIASRGRTREIEKLLGKEAPRRQQYLRDRDLLEKQLASAPTQKERLSTEGSIIQLDETWRRQQSALLEERQKHNELITTSRNNVAKFSLDQEKLNKAIAARPSAAEAKMVVAERIAAPQAIMPAPGPKVAVIQPKAVSATEAYQKAIAINTERLVKEQERARQEKRRQIAELAEKYGGAAMYKVDIDSDEVRQHKLVMGIAGAE